MWEIHAPITPNNPGNPSSDNLRNNTSLLLERVVEYRQVTAAVANGAPVITRSDTWRGRGLWTLETPLLVTFYAGNRQETEKLVVTALIVRVPREERPAGIGIQQIIAERTG